MCNNSKNRNNVTVLFNYIEIQPYQSNKKLYENYFEPSVNYIVMISSCFQFSFTLVFRLLNAKVALTRKDTIYQDNPFCQDTPLCQFNLICPDILVCQETPLCPETPTLWSVQSPLSIRFAFFLLPAVFVNCFMPITNSLLLIANFLLPITNCKLSMTNDQITSQFHLNSHTSLTP